MLLMSSIVTAVKNIVILGRVIVKGWLGSERTRAECTKAWYSLCCRLHVSTAAIPRILAG